MKRKKNLLNLLVDPAIGIGIILLALGVCYTIAKFTGFRFVYVLVGILTLLIGSRVILVVCSVIWEVIHNRDEY